MEKKQPWKAAWPPASTTAKAQTQDDAAASAVEYGVAKGGVVVVDGTAANVKPAAPLRLQQAPPSSAAAKSQPWKAAWPPAAATGEPAAAPDSIEYGVAQGATVVVDGTAANVKPSSKAIRVALA